MGIPFSSVQSTETTAITEPLSRLIELDLVRRDLSFGELEKNSKKGLYKIKDPLLRFYYRFVSPYRSLLQMDHIQGVMEIIRKNLNDFQAQTWERLCQEYISGAPINGITFGAASNWSGKNKKGEMIELDVVAQSLDNRHLLIGECKWTKPVDAEKLKKSLIEKCAGLSFVKEDIVVHYSLFLKEKPFQNADILKFYPSDIFGIT